MMRGGDGLCAADGITRADDRSEGYQPAPVPPRFRPSGRLLAAAAVVLVVVLRLLYLAAVAALEALTPTVTAVVGWVGAVAPWTVGVEVLVLAAVCAASIRNGRRRPVEEGSVAFFRVSPAEQDELDRAFAEASGGSPTSAWLRRQADRDEEAGCAGAAVTLRATADVREVLHPV